MCGISGILGNSTHQQIESMVDAMQHRGPDDTGIFHDAGIALGMARLAVIDITSAGHQPMCNQDGSVWIVYNGETYNFWQERAILEEKGHCLESHSDTEVVLRMYEVYGDDFLLRLRGMFALAIYDKRQGQGRERLLLARDHLGIKPLLYCHAGPRFLFASEMKALLASGLVERRVEPESLRLLLTFGSVTQPYTMLKDVRMLLPGHRLIMENGTERIERFWRMDAGRRGEVVELPYQELVLMVQDAIEESVRLQMLSDVPLGAFLSGGVDSSLLVALMAKNSRHRIKTFSVGFEAEGASMDESDDAEKTARFIGTEHSKVIVTGQDVRERICHIAAALDQPSVDGVNSYFVSLAARQAVTVAISGTGGDELFAGYPWFITMVAGEERDRCHPLRAILGEGVSSLARSHIFDLLAARPGRSGRILERFRSSYGFVPRYSRIYNIFGSQGASVVLSSAMQRLVSLGQDMSRDIDGVDELPLANPVERVSALCLRVYTQNQLLRDIDAVSMAHSLEVRVPLLDPLIADLALSLPRRAKLGKLAKVKNPVTASYRDTGTKRVLVDAGEGLLPPGMDRQPKRGFGMPFDAWLKGPLREVFNDALSSAAVKRRGFFDEETVSQLKEDFLAGKRGWPQPWLLMMTELWCREVLDRSDGVQG
jgi:asparagine synthase (glutamine-hydrolysing)